MPTFINLKTGEIKERKYPDDLTGLELVEDVPLSKWIRLVNKMYGWLVDLRDQNKDLIEAKTKVELELHNTSAPDED